MDKKYCLIRNDGEKRKAYNHLKSLQYPYVIITRNIDEVRSIEQNSYLWGVVYKHISDYTGFYTYEVHDFYKKIFLLQLKVKYKRLILTNQSTTDLSKMLFSEYIENIIIHARVELNIDIPESNELYEDEKVIDLIFKHD